MILTREKIQAAIQGGEIAIRPFEPESVESASYNVTLHSHIRVFVEGLNEIDVTEVAANAGIVRDITRVVEIPAGGYYLLKPGELVIGMTVETLHLAPDIAGWLQGRSRFARMGLMVHVTASFLQPGINNKQVFEIFNASRNAIKLRPGVKIAQIIFQRCEGRAEYGGVFANQLEI